MFPMGVHVFLSLLLKHNQTWSIFAAFQHVFKHVFYYYYYSDLSICTLLLDNFKQLFTSNSFVLFHQSSSYNPNILPNFTKINIALSFMTDRSTSLPHGFSNWWRQNRWEEEIKMVISFYFCDKREKNRPIFEGRRYPWLSVTVEVSCYTWPKLRDFGLDWYYSFNISVNVY